MDEMEKREDLMVDEEFEEETFEIEVYDEEPEEEGDNVTGKVVAGTLAAVGLLGVGLFAFRKKIGKKIKEWKINSLRKQGYIVTENEIIEPEKVDIIDDAFNPEYDEFDD